MNRLKEKYLERFRKEYPESPVTNDGVLDHYVELSADYNLKLSPEGMDRDGKTVFRLLIPLDSKEFKETPRAAEVGGIVREQIRIDLYRSVSDKRDEKRDLSR